MTSSVASLLSELHHPSLPGIDLRLDRMWAVLEALGNPHHRLPPAIHVAGTNGKGSTIAFLKAMYEAQGYRVHRYTSPHLCKFNERIELAGAAISDALLHDYLLRVRDVALAHRATFFESTTAAAFLAFSEHEADLLLLEVGMGGRLDATNVISYPLATVITPVGMDHMEFLGADLTAIAAEKAGIIKPGVPCVVAEQATAAGNVIHAKADELGAPLYMCGWEWSYSVTREGFTLHAREDHLLPAPSLAGEHQYGNAATAAITAMLLRSHLPVADSAIAAGIKQAIWPARLQTLRQGMLVDAWRGSVVLDGGHNVAAAHELAAWMHAQSHPVSLLVGMMKRKDAYAFFHALAPHVQAVACITVEHQPDAMPAQQLAQEALNAGIHHVVVGDTLAQAVADLRAHGEGVLLVTGSLYLAGELLKTHA